MWDFQLFCGVGSIENAHLEVLASFAPPLFSLLDKLLMDKRASMASFQLKECIQSAITHTT